MEARIASRKGRREGSGAPAPGLTLVELIVSIAIVSVMLGALLPALGAARAAARSAVCASRERGLYLGVAQWARENRDTLPGVNTTGLPYRGKVSDIVKLLGATTADTPTSTFDWISPAMGRSLGFSPSRAERTRQIFNDLACPASRRMNTALWPASARSLADFDDFERIFRKGGFRQISYLSPAPFHYRGPGFSRHEFETYPFAGPAITPEFYLPRMEGQGGQPARKALIADGTRYLASRSALDFDLSPNPEYYGSFTSATPIYEGSTAYGRAKATAGFDAVRPGAKRTYPLNRDLSYRHGGKMNVVFFDGHVDSLGEIESKTDASLWYPTGSLFTGRHATPESIAFHRDDKTLP